MLSDSEREELDKELHHAPTRRAAALEGLAIVQRHRGWVSDEAIGDLSRALDLAREEIDGIATFYNLIFRRPVGRHVILLCDSVSCWICGATGIRKALEAKLETTLGTTTADDRFTLLPMCCLGDCDHAPVLMVDRDTHRDVSVDDLDRILEGYE